VAVSFFFIAPILALMAWGGWHLLKRFFRH